jgi:hypothetical protein
LAGRLSRLRRRLLLLPCRVSVGAFMLLGALAGLWLPEPKGRVLA